MLPGAYNASVEVAYSKKKKLKQAETISVNLQGDVVNGADFILTELEFIKGYTATLGNFHSLSMLKTYWQLSKHRYQNELNHQVFYIHNKKSGLYDLQGGVFKHKKEAEQVCDYLTQQSISCKVNNFEFDITSD